MSLFDELKRRKVFKVGAAYVVIAWLAVQVASIGFPAFDAPPWALRVFILILSLGFPASLVMAWVLEVTPEGIRVDATGPGRKRVFAVAALLGVLAFGWYLRGQQPHVAEQVPAAAAPAASIAVLPFADLSQNKDQEYFSDGLSEELLDLLAKIPELRVAGRTSAFAFKGKADDLRVIGQKLNVATVLEGSVRRSGDRVRITTQLINVADGFHLWSETYDREMTDIFAVQDEIAGAVVAALKLKLLPQQVPVAGSRHKPGIDAYNEYLLGRQFFNRGSPDDYRKSATYFRRAAELDREFAAAFAAFAVAQVAIVQFPANAEEATSARREAAKAVEEALRLDPDVAETYAARGLLRMVSDLDWGGAETDIQHALTLNPGNAIALRRWSTVLAATGRMPESLAAIKRAVDLDPLSVAGWGQLGYYLDCAGRYAEARTALDRALEISEGRSVTSLYNLGVLALLEGNPADALVRFERIPEGQYFRLAGIAMAEFQLGHEGQSRKALDALIAMPTRPPVWIAAVYTIRGERDQAFQWLDRAAEERDYYVRNVGYDSIIGKLRDDPRYDAFLKRIGLRR